MVLPMRVHHHRNLISIMLDIQRYIFKLSDPYTDQLGLYKKAMQLLAKTCLVISKSINEPTSYDVSLLKIERKLEKLEA